MILKVLGELNDIVVPTYGARGRLAMIDQLMDRPTLTDDGVTVIKSCRHMKGWAQMIASGVIEAAHNTERTAYDGTTLTTLLTYEIFNRGMEMIEELDGHPQVVADILSEEIQYVLKALRKNVVLIDDEFLVRTVANITTKIPELGEILVKAYQSAGAGMNIMIEHDRKVEHVDVEHTQGYALESGYWSDAMRVFCNEEDVTEFTQAKLVLLKEGIMTHTAASKFFGSIPEEEKYTPMVFVVTPGINPEALQVIVKVITDNNLNAQFLFMNEPQADEVYKDLSALSNAKVQDITTGNKEYLWEHAGMVEWIQIKQNATLIKAEGDVTKRIKEYKEYLDDNRFSLDESSRILTERRLSALENGITKIKLGSPTIVEFKTMKLKLDDGIGAVREALKRGVVLGGGKALFNIAPEVKQLSKVLEEPLKQICLNGGIKPHTKRLRGDNELGINVKTGEYVNLIEEEILDSIASIEDAVTNAGSIACNYLRTYILITEKDKEKA